MLILMSTKKDRRKKGNEMSDKLKPCPHCGETPKEVSSGMGEFWINCKCQSMKSTEKAAITAWNRRADNGKL